MFTDDQIQALNTARSILKEIGSEAAKNRNPKGRDWLEPDGFAFGELYALVDSAEHAIFQALNVANATNIRKMSEDQLHNRDQEARA